MSAPQPIRCPRCSSHPRFPRDGIVRPHPTERGFCQCLSCGEKFKAPEGESVGPWGP